MMIIKDNVRKENAPSQVGWQAAMPTVSAGYILHHILQLCCLKIPGCQGGNVVENKTFSNNP